MGLLKRDLYLLAIEHKKHPIKGNVLTLSQQAVDATLDEVKLLLKNEKICLNNLPPGFDTKSKIPDWQGTGWDNSTNCQTVLTLLGAERVYAADISNYENPDIIMDLNVPVDNKYHNKFDVILDAGTLEHIFNIPQALENIRLMAKPGGTIILITPASGAIDHGFYQISPTLYYDYFGINGFENFSCFILEGSGSKGKIYKYKPDATGILTLVSKKGIAVAFFASKSTNNNLKTNMPIQGLYNASPYWHGESKSAYSEKKNLLKKFIIYLFFISRKWRPDFIDRIWTKLRTKNKIIYIGRY